MSVFSLKSFANPPKRARPLVRWWWPGLDVEIDELVREVEELDQAGFLGAEIQAFMIGAPGRLSRRDPERYARSHRFMQPFYYEAVKAVLDKAASRDMVIDLTICSAWPAGGTHVTLDDSMKVLLMGSKVVRGGQHYAGRVPPPKKPFFYTLAGILRFFGLLDLQSYLRDRMRLVRVVGVRPVGAPGRVRSWRPRTSYLNIESAVDLTDRVSEEGVLEWDVPVGAWQVFAFYDGPSGTHALMEAREEPEGEALVLNHLARGPVERHLEHHLGRGKAYFGEHFGKTLRAFFTDSLELAAEWSWTDDFLSEFETRRGYDLTPYLPVNYVPGRDNKYLSIMTSSRPCFDFEGDLGERIRYDFERTVSDLFTERFAQAMTDWANANGLQSRIQAYGIRADTLKTYGIAHIPETEQLYAGGALDFLRLAGSAGAIYDKPLVTSESMVWNQRDYMTTPLKWKVAADRLFVSGINQMIYHGFPYQNPAYPYPGYDPFSSPYGPKLGAFASNFSRMNPFWEFFGQMNAYITRCQYVLQQGRMVCSVGLYYDQFNYPDAVLVEEELIGGVLPRDDAPPARRALGAKPKANPDEEERWTQTQIQLADHLLSNGYGYVHINPESVLAAQIQDAKLVIGAARLDVLVLSQVERIPLDVAFKLREIVKAGVPVVFVGRVPDKQPGFHNYRENDALVADLVSTLAEENECVVYTFKGVASYLADRLGILPDVGFATPQPHIHHAHRRVEDVDLYLVRNARPDPVRVDVRLAHPGRVPTFLDPWTGAVTIAGQYGTDEGGVTVPLSLPAYGSCILCLAPGQEPVHALPGEVMVQREGESLAAYVRQAGSYSFVLNAGQEITLEEWDDAPPQAELARWHLSVERRGRKGPIAPLRMDLEALDDWRNIPNLQHCSGKGTYTAHVDLPESYLQEDVRVTLDLGRVHDAAVVEVNGARLEPLLVYPYEVEVTAYLTVGRNEIVVTVTPTLYNRLVGYGQSGSADWKQFRRRKELMPSGLIGPVRLVAERRLEVLAGDSMEEPVATGEAADREAPEVTDEIQRDVTEGSIAEIAKDVPEGAAKDAREDIAGDAIEDITEDIEKDAAKDVAEGAGANDAPVQGDSESAAEPSPQDE